MWSTSKHRQTLDSGLLAERLGEPLSLTERTLVRDVHAETKARLDRDRAEAEQARDLLRDALRNRNRVWGMPGRTDVLTLVDDPDQFVSLSVKQAEEHRRKERARYAARRRAAGKDVDAPRPKSDKVPHRRGMGKKRPPSLASSLVRNRRRTA